MSRGRKRNQRKHSTQSEPKAFPGESARSKAYEAGQTVRYAYRIHGPTFPVKILRIDDLEPGSQLR